MKLETQMDLIVAKLVQILKGKGTSERIPKFMTLKSSRNPNHPLLMVRLRKGIGRSLVAQFKEVL
jgi:hypothetical protein